jgi:hypothetical protein
MKNNKIFLLIAIVVVGYLIYKKTSNKTPTSYFGAKPKPVPTVRITVTNNTEYFPIEIKSGKNKPLRIDPDPDPKYNNVKTYMIKADGKISVGMFDTGKMIFNYYTANTISKKGGFKAGFDLKIDYNMLDNLYNKGNVVL